MCQQAKDSRLSQGLHQVSDGKALWAAIAITVMGWVSTSLRGLREEVVLFLVSSVSDKFLGLVPLA